MSASEPALPSTSPEPVSTPLLKLNLAARLVHQLERAGEWLNPILVKESRQALKSRQFAITFSLLLLCGWLWSIVGIVLIGPSAYYNFAGRDMFFGYFAVLAFPLLVIVPVGAFRSLAAEYEDRTFELVSITTLYPRQIVAGKLGSAVVQMIVYLSALAPCLAFTYILRGIDILQIVFILTLLSLASLAFSTIALMLSTVAHERLWQGVLSIAVIAACLAAFGGSCSIAHELLSGATIPVHDPEFWIAMAIFLTIYITYLVLFFQAAAAQLTFTSDNRSTPLRVTMLAQFLLLVGCFAGAGTFAFLDHSEDDFTRPMIVFVLMAGLHWYGMGLFMVIEQPNLSPRAKRKLPRSFLGRVFLTWFNPGPGAGYLFAIGNMAAASIIALGSLFWLRFYGYVKTNVYAMSYVSFWNEPAAVFTVLTLGYLVFYLGLGKLCIGLIRRRLKVGFFSGAAIQAALLMLGCFVPLLVERLFVHQGGNFHELLLHLTNPILILADVERIRYSGNSIELQIIGRFVSALALIVFALNLPGIIREVRHVRIAAPRRVTEDEAEPSVKT